MFAKVADGVWTPGIGDPTLIGWVTVAAYFVAAALAMKAAHRMHRERGSSAREQFWFWMVSGGLLLLLGMNKQLDLQTGMTWLFKRWALDQGWYERRRFYQALFIAGIAVAGLGFLAVLLWFIRGRFRRHGLGLAGVVFLVCFVVIRAASFHHVDKLLGLDVGGMKVNWMLELGGIACVLFGARRVLKQT